MERKQHVFKMFLKILNQPGKMNRLVQYVDKLLLKKKIRGGAYTARDVIYEVMIKMACEDRNWNEERDSDIYSPFFLMCRSFIWDIAKREKHMIKSVMMTEGEECEYDERRFTEYIDMKSLHKNEIRINTGDEEKLYSVCMDLLNSDTECGLVLLGIIEGQSWKEIAEDLSITVQKVNGIMTRIRRELRGSSLSRDKDFIN